MATARWAIMYLFIRSHNNVLVQPSQTRDGLRPHDAFDSRVPNSGSGETCGLGKNENER